MVWCIFHQNSSADGLLEIEKNMDVHGNLDWCDICIYV